jgi:hypothetical protein
MNRYWWLALYNKVKAQGPLEKVSRADRPRRWPLDISSNYKINPSAMYVTPFLSLNLGNEIVASTYVFHSITAEGRAAFYNYGRTYIYWKVCERLLGSPDSMLLASRVSWAWPSQVPLCNWQNAFHNALWPHAYCPFPRSSELASESEIKSTYIN